MQILLFVGVFLAASLVMIFSTECMGKRGLEGTAIGTLILPYCSGAPNIIFVVVLALQDGAPREVLINATVNNLTNLTLLLGVPALLWGLTVVPERRSSQKTKTEHRLNRLSLLATLTAGLFFTVLVWVLGQDGVLALNDGMVLVGIFVFWQVLEVFGVMKSTVAQKRRVSRLIALDILLLGASGGLVFYSVDRLVGLISAIPEGFVSIQYLGWLSGWLMVLPNAVPAFYYAARKRADITYSSQAGDAHICIPLCIGLGALMRPTVFDAAMARSFPLLAVIFLLHIACVGILGRLPRWCAVLLVGAYGYFLYTGLAA
ncbi:MAG: sodium:calcium symporter [Verrucomicrobiota bacterium]